MVAPEAAFSWVFPKWDYREIFEVAASIGFDLLQFFSSRVFWLQEAETLIGLVLARYAWYTSARELLTFVITTGRMITLITVNINNGNLLDIFQSDKVMLYTWMWYDLLIVFIVLLEKWNRVETGILLLLKLFYEFIWFEVFMRDNSKRHV